MFVKAYVITLCRPTYGHDYDGGFFFYFLNSAYK